MRRSVALIALALVACGDDEAELTIELVPGQSVVAVSTIDGTVTAQVVAFVPGEPVRIPADPETPIFTWILDENDFVLADGQPLIAADFANVRVRTIDETATENGACSRCLVPSTRAPQVVSDGDQCAIPVWNGGAVWRPGSERYECAGAEDSRLCQAGSVDDTLAIELMRERTFLEWPGACACEPKSAAANLSTMTMQAIAPDGAPWPLTHFAATDDGEVAGFSRHGAAIWNPSTQVSTFTRFDDLEVSIQAAAALPGGDFLLATEQLNTAFGEGYVYYRVSVTDGRVSTPTEVDIPRQALAERLQYVEGAEEYSLYVLGGIPDLGSVEPGGYACKPDTLVCQRLNVGACPDERRFSRLTQVDTLPDGTGIGLSQRGLFYRAPNAPPAPNPHPSDTWSCRQFEDDVPNRDGSKLTEIDALGSMARIGDRVFVCAKGLRRQRCDADRAVVLSATVSAAVDEFPTPDWRVVWEGGDWSSCRDFLPVEASGIARLQLGGRRTIDFDQEANEIASRPASEVYGSFDRMGDLQPLGNGYVLAPGGENQVYVNTGTTSFTRIYGPETLGGASFRAAVAAPNDDFYAFGDPRGIVRVSGTAPTLLETNVLADIRVEAVAIDTAESADGRLVFLVGGVRSGDAHLVRIQVNNDAVTTDPQLDLPSDFNSNLDVVDLAEIAPGRFIAVMQGTRMLRIDGNAVTEIPANFDDPTTEVIEDLPRPQADACSGNTPRLDAWRRVVGAGGVAWASGLHGLLVRVVDSEMERFVVERPLELSALRADCSDLVIAGGRGSAGQLNEPNTNLAFFETMPAGLSDDPEEVQIGARPIEVVRIAEEELFSLGLGEVQYARPLALLRDRTTDRSEAVRAIGVGLDNGFVYRLMSSEPIGYLRAPFWPRQMAQASNGTVLFVGSEGRLALGVPTP